MAFTSVTKVAVFSSFEIATSLTFVIKRASFSALSSFVLSVSFTSVVKTTTFSAFSIFYLFRVTARADFFPAGLEFLIGVLTTEFFEFAVE